MPGRNPYIEDDLIRDEALRLKPYRCTAGKLSIGVGRNLEDIGITRDEALHLLANDIARVEVECRAAFPWFDALDPVRQAVVLNMAFNLGLPKFRLFKQTLAAIAAGRYDAAARQMQLSKWARQVGDRAKRLARMMRTGLRS